MRALILRWRATPFGTLTSHFFRRFFEPESVAGDSPLRAGFGPILGLLSMPGAILALVLFHKYSPLLRYFRREFNFNVESASLPDKYFYISASIAITAIVTALKWDSLFPDRRDFLNLAPLPISLRSIFLAKLLALTAFAFVFVTSLNAISSVLFPLVVLEENGALEPLLRFVTGHIAAVMGASMATFCVLLGLVGLLMSVLSYGLFRKISRYVQFVVISAALVCFFLTSAFYPGLETLRKDSYSAAVYFPPVWFLGWYVEIQGMASPIFAEAAGWARWLLAGSLLLSLVSYALSYRRYFLKAAETREIIPSLRSLADRFFPILDRTVLCTGSERAAARFVLKTLFRSDRHSTVLALSLGTAFALITTSIAQSSRLKWNVPAEELLAIPLAILFFGTTALRITFGMPSELKANWIFQTGIVDDTDPRRLACKLAFLFAAPVVLLAGVSGWILWGPLIALMHSAFVAVVATLLILFLFRDFRMLPFTGAGAPPDNLVMVVAGYLVSFFFVVYGLSGTESFMLQHPGLFAIFYTFAGLAIVALVRASEERERVIFEAAPGSFELLRLSE